MMARRGVARACQRFISVYDAALFDSRL